MWADHIFLGWALTKDAAAAEYLPGSAYPADGTATLPYESVTLYAVWEEVLTPVQFCTVTYDANGGTGAPAPQTAMLGQPVTISAQRPVLNGYLFAGWALTSDSTVLACQPGHINNGAQSITLYAVWTQEQRTIIFDDNGGEHGPGRPSFTGERVNLSPVTPVRQNYRFDGWALSKNHPASLKPGSVFTWPANHQETTITLYAVWIDDPACDIDPPQTGDTAEHIVWTALLILSAAGAIMIRKRRYL